MDKISIVVPCYGTEKYIDRCLDSLLKQTYQNLQIVVVNDCSKGNMLEILNNYAKKDKRIKVVNNIENKGLYKTRIIGSKECDGDYIAFVDSDDYVEKDFYRTLINNIKKTGSDIAISSFANSSSKGIFLYNLLDKTNNKILNGKEILDNYFKQEGQNFRWHVVWDKLINKKIWDMALPYYEKLEQRITMTEDFIFSTISLFFANKVSFCDEAHYFYCDNDNQSTSTKNLTLRKVSNNINDIIISYSFVKNFLKEKKVLKKYEDNVNKWECYYLNMHYRLLTSSIAKAKEKKEILEMLNDKVDFSNIMEKIDVETLKNYYLVVSKYDDGLEKIKEQICDKKTKVVSFDLFDTLVVRPFYVPSDMFQLLDKEFIEKSNCNSIVKFSKIRKDVEIFLRGENWRKNIHEVTLKEIYNYIQTKYSVDKKIINYFMNREIEMELEFCKKRKTGYDLYLLAKEFNKKVIVTSDIYLDKETIEKILKNNDYEINKVYLSSVIKKTKAEGDLYSFVLEHEKINPTEMIHIGDNYKSDVEKAKEKDINALHLPRTVDKFMNSNNCGTFYEYMKMFNVDTRPYIDNFGVRCSIALVANKFFDNPFVNFCEGSTFNANPFLLGYYGLGMNILSIGNWLLSDTKKKKITSLSFMARDGLIPMKATEIIKKETNINKSIDLKYIYVSRKALMPLVIDSKISLNMLNTYLTSYTKINPMDVLKQLKVILKDAEKEKYVKFVRKNGYNENHNFKDYDEFICFLQLLYDEWYDKKKYLTYYNLAKKYLEEFYSDNSATFDIGYSGKPESLITKIIGKPVHTYFVHTNSSEAYNNSCLSEYELNTFIDFKPTLTGTIRELLYSDIHPSCVGYEYDEENKKTIPVFGKEESYTYFNIDIINSIQNSSLEFVKDFSTTFSKYFSAIDLNRYYMSLPYEYFLHYSGYFDNILMRNVLFEDNVKNKVELLQFIDSEFEYYRNNYCKEYKVSDENYNFYHNMLNEGYGRLPKRRMPRVIYYALYDRESLKYKYDIWKDKTNKPLELPRSRFKRAVYYLIFDKKKFLKRLVGKKK